MIITDHQIVPIQSLLVINALRAISRGRSSRLRCRTETREKQGAQEGVPTGQPCAPGNGGCHRQRAAVAA
jgi:hypothetical protein